MPRFIECIVKPHLSPINALPDCGGPVSINPDHVSMVLPVTHNPGYSDKTGDPLRGCVAVVNGIGQVYVRDLTAEEFLKLCQGGNDGLRAEVPIKVGLEHPVIVKSESFDEARPRR